jgi:peptide/nickel transport system substrate-binding protein
VTEFRVLGPLEALGPSGLVRLGGGKQQLLLAVLVLRAGELVSRSTIIDALWPEDPPPSAGHTVESYVSRLRAALRSAGGDAGMIVSGTGGYRLLREGNRFDFDSFTGLTARARTALDAGEANTALEMATRALALWRGPALAGLADRTGVRADAAAWDERRLVGLELRAEAGLALGRGETLISELRAEASRQPVRERAHELLMLALYRSGRQAEALEVYRTVHEHLDREVGLGPGPGLRDLQARILRQDPSLDGVRSEPASSSPRPADRRSLPRATRTRGAALAAGVALITALTITLILLSGGTEAATGTLRTPALGVLNPRDGRPVSAVKLDVVPTQITTGLGAEWVTSYYNGTLLRVDPGDPTEIQTVDAGRGATGVTVDAGDVWVAASLDDRLVRVDGRSEQVVQRIKVGTDPTDVAAGAGALWITNQGDGTVSRVDPRTGAVLGVTRVGPSPEGVAVGDGAVWVALNGASALARLDPQTGHLVQTIGIGSGPSEVAVDRAGVWVANELDSTVSLVSPTTNRVILTHAVVGAPTSLAAVSSGVWVGGEVPKLTLLQDSGVVHTVPLPSPAAALADGPSGLLVGVSGVGADHRGGTLVIRVSDPIDQINPEACCTQLPDVRMLSYDGLLSYSKSPANPAALVPDLALAIPPAQDGGLEYSFHLRPGIRYWNGSPVRASDFRVGLERAARSSSILADYIGALPGAASCPGQPRCDLDFAVLTNDRAGTVTLRLTHPDPDLLPALGLPAFAPAPADAGTGAGVRPGTGPYRIARFVAGKLIDFARNPYFEEWAPAAQPAGYPDRILLYSDGSPSSDIAAVLGGRADYTFDAPTPVELQNIQLHEPGLLHADPLPDTDFLDLNTREAPFNNVRVRQALNFAVDRRAIAALYGGPAAATPTCQIIPATVPGHVPYCPYTRDPSPSGRWSAPDLPRARGLIVASGTRGESVTVLTEAPSGPWDEPAARYIVGLLRRLGYHARLRVLTENQLAAARVNYRHPLQIDTNSWIADFPSPSQWVTAFLSCAAWRPPTRLDNHSQFCAPAVDRLATRASQLEPTDPGEADDLWARADRRITNLAPWIPTVTETETDLVSRRVGNYEWVPSIGALLDQLWVR